MAFERDIMGRFAEAQAYSIEPSMKAWVKRSSRPHGRHVHCRNIERRCAELDQQPIQCSTSGATSNSRSNALHFHSLQRFRRAFSNWQPTKFMSRSNTPETTATSHVHCPAPDRTTNQTTNVQSLTNHHKFAICNLHFAIRNSDPEPRTLSADASRCLPSPPRTNACCKSPSRCVSALGVIMLAMGQRDARLAVVGAGGNRCVARLTDIKQWLRLNRILANIAGLTAVAISLGDFMRFDNDTQLFAIANLLIYLQIVLLFQPKTLRVYWQILVLSLLEVVVGAALNLGACLAC